MNLTIQNVKIFSKDSEKGSPILYLHGVPDTNAVWNAVVEDLQNSCIKNGAKDNGSPGSRPHYGDNYYAAFIFDLDGYRIEAVHK